MVSKQQHGFLRSLNKYVKNLTILRKNIKNTFSHVTDSSSDDFNRRYTNILEMIAKGVPASEVYHEIGLLYEHRNVGMRCSMLELHGNMLLHGGAPSMPTEYCVAVNGLIIGPNIGSCGAATYSGQRVLAEDIKTDPNWTDLKQFALPHGMRCCWSEPIISSSGKVLGAFGMYYDYPALPDENESADLTAAAMLSSIVMERDHNQKRIQELAYIDELTGFSSRAHFHLSLENIIKTSLKNSEKFGLIYIDLDNFKDINDSFGHDVGDIYLQDIAQRLTTVSGDTYLISRLGGDEFCIIVEETTEEDRTAMVAQRCLDIISKPTNISGRKFTQSCSMGITFYPDHGLDVRNLLKAGDTALYKAKECGKNQYVFYDKKLTEAAEYRFKVEQLLRESIENQTLSVVYQPQIDLTSNKIIAVEALSRWYHPKLGNVSPVEFITIAERIGMINQLTEYVLHKACSQAVRWRELGHPVARVAVNISADHFLEEDFIPLIQRIVGEIDLGSIELELEVTESVIQTKPKNVSVLQSLKEFGIRLAIDDFGTGYSSFASLKHIAVDILKIDKYFIDDILCDNKSKNLVESMIVMAHNLGYKVVAEGVETVEQAQALKKLKCDIAQGYLISKPSSPERISKLLIGGCEPAFL